MDDRKLEDLVAAAWWRAACGDVPRELPPATSLNGARYRANARAVLADLDRVGVLRDVPAPGPRTWTVPTAPTVDAAAVTDCLGAVWERRSDGSWWCPAEPQRPAYRDGTGLLVAFGPLIEVQKTDRDPPTRGELNAMPRTIDSILEAHHAAEERRQQGRPIWDRRIYLGDVFHNEDLTFEQRRDAIVARIGHSSWFREEYEESGVLADLLEELADTVDGDEFDGPWDEIYDLADADRVWIETTS